MFKNENVFGKINRKEIKRVLSTFGIEVSLNYISQQKANVFLPYSIPRTAKTIELMERVKTLFNVEERVYWRR